MAQHTSFYEYVVPVMMSIQIPNFFNLLSIAHRIEISPRNLPQTISTHYQLHTELKFLKEISPSLSQPIQNFHWYHFVEVQLYVLDVCSSLLW